MPTGPIVVGLSGGGDSTALLALLLKAAPADQPVHALIVDHQLRQGSTLEAQSVAEQARTLGAQAHILTWKTPKASQQAARLARHQMLAEASRELGASVLFLGHTLDDRIETYLMRRRRSQASRSRSIMPKTSPSPVWPQGRGLCIARPLIAERRSCLRDFLQEQGLGWTEDPSNKDDRYERVRIRNALALEDGREIPDHQQLEHWARQEAETLNQARVFIQSHAKIAPWGGIKLNRVGFTASQDDVAHRVMELAILAVSGQQAMPGHSIVGRFCNALIDGQALTGGGAALSHEGWLGRDRGAVTGRKDGAPGVNCQTLKPGETSIWDGRFEITPLRTVSVVLCEKSVCDRVYGSVPETFRQSLPLLQETACNPRSLFDSELVTTYALTQDRLDHLTMTVK